MYPTGAASIELCMHIRMAVLVNQINKRQPRPRHQLKVKVNMYVYILVR